MDLRSWKKVLLEWVKECNFVKTNYRTLEESDIEEFFDVYMQQDEVTLLAQQRQKDQMARKYSPTSGRSKYQQFPLLQSFLRSIYPDFSPHLDDEGRVVGADYLYVYTLLMHYACVKNPTEFFHIICKRLPDLTQECIAKFFEQTVEKPQLSRELLRQAIVNVSTVYRRSGILSSPKSSSRSRRRSGSDSPKSLNTTCSSSRSFNSNDSILDSPGKKEDERKPELIPSPPPPSTTPVTQQRLQLNKNAPPPTPKSEMLEQQNRELLGLRAQLQTKRYENNVLEEQIMENEHLIASLTKDNNEKKQQLAKLKASLANGEEGNGDMRNYVPNEIEHLKRSMRKEISLKEAIIAEMNDRLQDLHSENCELTNKLKISEKHLKVCMDRIDELEIRLEAASDALKCRMDELNCLERDKLELEECLQQTRDELHQRREILNSSSDLLDTSATASVGSHNVTPENLASSVVDKQLREKQLENEQLRTLVEALNLQRSKWSENLKRLLQQYPGSMDKHEFVSEDDLKLIEKTLKNLESNWRQEQRRSQHIQQLLDKQALGQTQLLEHVQELSGKVKTLEQQLSQAQLDCKGHEQQHILELEQRHDHHIKEMNDLQEKLERQTVRFELHQKQYDDLEFRYDELRASATEADRHLCQMRQKLAEKEQQFIQLGAEILQLRSKNQAHEERIDALVSERLSENQRSQKEIDELASQIEVHQETVKHVRCKYRQCHKELNVHTCREDQLLNGLLHVNDWEEAIAKVEALIKNECEIEEKYNTEIKKLKQRLQESTDAQEQVSAVHEQQVSDLQQQLRTITQRYDEQRLRNNEFIHQIQQDLTQRERHLQTSILERQTASDIKVSTLRERAHYTTIQLERFLHKVSKLIGIPNDTNNGIDDDDDDGIESEIDSDSSGSRFTENQNRIDEVLAVLVRLMRSTKQLETNLDEKTAELDELTRQHALALTGNQQWTAKVQQEREISGEIARVALAQKDEEIHASNQRISLLQIEVNQQRSMVEQLMAKLAKTMEQLEAQDLAAIEMVHSLNEHMANNPLTSTTRIPPINPSQVELGCESSNFSQLRSSLLQFEAGFEQLESSRLLLDQQFAEATREASDLASAKMQLKRQIVSLEQKLASENDLVNTKMGNQLNHLNCSLQNLEEVNEKLSAENERLQSLLSELDEVQSTSHVQVAALQAELNQRDEQLGQLHENLQSKIDEMMQMQVEIETLQKQLNAKAKEGNKYNVDHENRLKLVEQLMDDLEVLRKQSEKKTQQRDEATFALERQQNDIQRWEEKHASVMAKLEEATAVKELAEQKLKQSEETLAQRDEQILKLGNELKESEVRVMTDKSESNAQLKLMHHEVELIQQKLELAQQSKSALTDEIGTLTSKIKEQDALLAEREKELGNLELKLTKEQEKSEQLEQQLAKLEQEKAALTEQKERVQVQVRENKEMMEKNHEQTQLLRQELGKEQTHNELQQHEMTRLEQELLKAKNQLESSTNRTEKMAVKLGELQASHSKLQKEFSQCQQAQEGQTETISSLQQEKELLLDELDQTKDRLARSEQREITQMKQSQEAHNEAIADMQREIQSLQNKLEETFTILNQSKSEAQTKIVSLQQQLDSMHLIKQNAEIERATVNERLAKLEKLRETQDRNVRNLNHQLRAADDLKVQLNYEIGGLNSEIHQQKKQLTDLNRQLQQSVESVRELKMQLEVAQSERDQGREELAQLSHKLSELQQEVVGNQLIHESVQCELDEKTRDLEIERQENADRIARYQARLDELQQQLAEKNQELNELNSSHNDLCATYTKNSDQETNAKEMAMEQLQQERGIRQQLELDCQILQAKYRDAKEEVIRCEQKIKDQRLEMEGKLEKMKNKMRTLYTAEVTRMKEKQERDASNNQAKLDAINAQNAKYEEHTRKLSNQIVRLNDKILEQQKQHAILSTKLRHLQTTAATISSNSTSPTGGESLSGEGARVCDDWQPFKRPNIPSGANLGTNLAMEDEEGEVFNNTYLTDLKLGRVPDAMMTAEELNYRNSLQPPHLRSTYAAQYDLGGIPDDDLRDGPHSCSLDDSMSALLSTTGTSTGTRKKTIGTHYKRPGPPTPSKNGGRLSFGGNSDPPREILRETCDNGSSGTSKTPARFKIFSSRFSLGNSSGLPRDENSPPKRRLSSMFKRK